MKKLELRVLFLWIFAAVMVLAGASPAFGAGASGTYRIVVLGDSLAAGYEPGMTVKSVPYGFAERIYEQALFRGRAKLSNFGIIGLNTEGLIQLLKGAADGRPLKSQDIQDFSMFLPDVAAMADRTGAKTAELKTSLAGANLVAIMIGGNDFGEFLKAQLTRTKEEINEALDVEFINIVNKYTENAEKTIRQTNALAPGARILLTDQYLPLPKLFAMDLAEGLYDALYEKAVAPITAAVDGLAAKLQAEGLPVEAVHIAERFKGKEGSMTHMKVSISGESNPDIHPTQDGYEAIAAALAEAVWKEYRKPAARPAAVPLSLVISGKDWTATVKTVMKNNTSYVPLPEFVKALGAQLKWTAKTKTAVIKKNGVTITIAADAKTFAVNGVKTKLAAPAFLQKTGKESKPYVPITAVAAALKYEVTYRSQLQTIFVHPL